MYPKLIHLYGPFELNSYNAAIMVGIALFFWAVFRHPGREQWISRSAFFNISVESALAGIIGARLLHVLSTLHDYHSLMDIISIWEGGLSILGAFLGVLLYSLWVLKYKQLPLFIIYDMAALYAPLIHGTARIGCFLVGCCYGCPTHMPWAVTYTNPNVFAPLHVALHPSQLYSSLIFFMLFIALYFFQRNRLSHPGEISMLYLMGMSFERWFIDFFRGDRIMTTALFSFYQWIAILIFVTAAAIFIYLKMNRQHNSKLSIQGPVPSPETPPLKSER